MVGIGSKLIYLRKKAGFSTSELARRLGMSRAYLWQLEHEDRKSPSSDLLYEMSKQLNVTMEWFYETNEHCSRCGNKLGDEVHYLSWDLPYLCGFCFKDGEILLRAHADAMKSWIDEGKNIRRIGGEET